MTKHVSSLLSLQKVLEVIKKRYGSFKDAQVKDLQVKDKLKIYIRSCVKVTLLMNTCTPPMFIDCSDQIYDPMKHTKFEGKGNVISYFVWPCVYFSRKAFEDGRPVLEKGEVATSYEMQQMAVSSYSLSSSHHNNKGYWEEDEFQEIRMGDSTSGTQYEKRETPAQKTRANRVAPI